PYTATSASVRRRESAVNVEDVAGHIVGRRRCKKYRGTGDFRRVAPTSRRGAPLDPGRKLAVSDQRRIHRRLEESRRNAVDLDVMRRELDRQRTRQHLERAFV